MGKKKQFVKEETLTTVIVDSDNLFSSDEDDQIFKDLRNKLAEIRKRKEITGYILRNTASAIIDLKEPDRIVPYALFASQVMESSREISDLFEMDEAKSMLIEGKEHKVLCINIKGNKINIYMEKEANQAKILKLLPNP
jgi:predicted regulator of Ras-like GTPase activity (Roadblock/LC7/MglB family)